MVLKSTKALQVFRLPVLVEQRHVADQIPRRMANAAELRHALESQLSALDRFPAALLRQALAGRCE